MGSPEAKRHEPGTTAAHPRIPPCLLTLLRLHHSGRTAGAGYCTVWITYSTVQYHEYIFPNQSCLRTRTVLVQYTRTVSAKLLAAAAPTIRYPAPSAGPKPGRFACRMKSDTPAPPVLVPLHPTRTSTVRLPTILERRLGLIVDSGPWRLAHEVLSHFRTFSSYIGSL